MNLVADANELKSQIGFISGNVPSRPVHPVLGATYIKAQNDLLTLAATDHIVWVRQSIPVVVKAEGEIYVDAQLLNGIISSLGEGEVKLSLKKKLTITQSGKRRSLPLINGEDFPEEPKVEFTVGWDQSVSSFLSQAEQVSFAVASDMSRPVLMGINMDMVNQLMVGADGFRMAISKAEFSETELRPTFSTRFMQEIRRSRMSGAVSISVSERWMRGLSEDRLTVVWAKALVGDYPTQAAQITKTMLAKEGVTLEIQKSELVQSLSLSCLYADRARQAREDGILYLISNKGKIKLEMDVPNVAELKDTISGEAGGDILVKLNPQYFLEIINHISSDAVSIRFFGERIPILITDSDNPDWAVVQTQMVVREAPKVGEEEGDF